MKKESSEAFSYLAESFVKAGGIFVSGTDTGIGKTYVSCRLIEALRRHGLKTAVMKPAESGSNRDARALRKASGSQDSLELICPYRFKRPLAPGLAAEEEGRKIDFQRIEEAFKTLRKGRDGVLVEGAGGLLVPMGPKSLVLDLVETLQVPLLLVARAGLGTINHSLLSLAAARERSIQVLGVLLNGKKRAGDPSFAGNAAAIARYGKVSVFGPLAWGAKKLEDLTRIPPGR